MGLTISQLSSVSSLSDGDLLVVWRTSDGDTRKASLLTLKAWFEDNFASPEFETLITAPTSSGFTLQIGEQTENVWQIINPTTTFAAGTVTLPPVASCFDGQQVVVTCSEQVNTLTVAGNGATVTGAPTTLVAGGFFALRFNLLQQTWYCVSQSLGLTYEFQTIKINEGILDANGQMALATESATGTVDNWLYVQGAEAGSPPVLGVIGSDTDIDIDLVPKGAGKLKVAGIDVLTAESGQVLNAPEIIDGLISEPSFSQSIVTVAALGSASPSGQRKIVNNANSTTLGAVAVGGGANTVPVFSDGTNWRIG